MNTDNVIIQASYDDLMHAFEEALKRITNGESDVKKESPSKKNYVYGLAGLSNLLQCSTSTAQRIKSSGILDEAIRQPKNRRIMIIDADLVLELMKENRRKN